MMTNNNFNAYAFPPYDSALEAITASNICVLEHEGDRWGTRFEAMARNENAGFVSKLANRRECLEAIAKHQREHAYSPIGGSYAQGTIWQDNDTGQRYLYRGQVNGREVWLPYD